MCIYDDIKITEQHLVVQKKHIFMFFVLFYRKELQDNDAVRAALKSCRLASLLPPVGTEFLRPFTSASLEQMSQRKKEEKQKGKKKEQKVKQQQQKKTPILTLSSE